MTSMSMLRPSHPNIPELNCEVGVARALSFIFYISSHDNSFPLLTIMNKWEHRNDINVIKLTESKRLLVMLISCPF